MPAEALAQGRLQVRARRGIRRVHPDDLRKNLDAGVAVPPLLLVVREKSEPGGGVLGAFDARLLLDGRRDREKEGKVGRVLLHPPGPDVFEVREPLLLDERSDLGREGSLSGHRRDLSGRYAAVGVRYGM